MSEDCIIDVSLKMTLVYYQHDNKMTKNNKYGDKIWKKNIIKNV